MMHQQWSETNGANPRDHNQATDSQLTVKTGSTPE
jgi:hypothetical protein